MNNPAPRIMIVGDLGFGTLARSYQAAFEELGYQVSRFDSSAAVEKYCRFGALGRKFNTFVKVEAWSRKANRELVVNARRLAPQAVIVVGSCPVSAGALAQLKASLQVSLIHIWPDTLLNLDSALIDCLPLYDLECVYSLSALEPVKRLGANRVIWLPLAGDPRLHSPPEYAGTETAEKTKYGADVAFIGGWRPEREDALTALAESGRFNLKVWGPDWGQRCKSNPALMKVWQGRGLRGNEFAGAVAASKVNLNIIDQTNYPAANMRFFEIPCAGGLQISSRCPEMEGEFKHGEAIFYYRDAGELSDQILHLLGDIELCERVRQAGRGVLIGRHTYLHRAKQILALTINQDSTAHAGS